MIRSQALRDPIRAGESKREGSEGVFRKESTTVGTVKKSMSVRFTEGKEFMGD